MKTILKTLVGLAAALMAVACTELPVTIQTHSDNIPLLDRNVPSNLETAYFAMG